MKDIITSTDFLIPFICNTLLFFLTTRLYSLRNMSLSQLSSEFNLAFVLGKLVYQLGIYLAIAYLIISFIKGTYLTPILAVVLSVIIGILLTRNKNLKPSTQIPLQIMTFNCVLITIVFVAFLIYTISLV